MQTYYSVKKGLLEASSFWVNKGDVSVLFLDALLSQTTSIIYLKSVKTLLKLKTAFTWKHLVEAVVSQTNKAKLKIQSSSEIIFLNF